MSFYTNNRNSTCCPGPINGNPLNGLCEKVCIRTTKVFDSAMKQIPLQGVQQTVEKSENEKKENNNNELNIFNDICDKFKALKCISENEINEYIKTILLPFVLKSLEFLNGIN